MSISFAIELACWVSVAALIYTYAGYPVLIAILGFLFPRPVHRGPFFPKISLIITAYNEERDLAAKLENTLSLDYPRELLEIIVASDCSSDRTDDIAREFAPRGVLLLRQPRRLGKTAAQNAALPKRTERSLFSLTRPVTTNRMSCRLSFRISLTRRLAVSVGDCFTSTQTIQT
jgi:cellulose synthase/poly-beta-1,6-N-acetylglucosamine synthase-like glycosyltransferase